MTLRHFAALVLRRVADRLDRVPPVRTRGVCADCKWTNGSGTGFVDVTCRAVEWRECFSERRDPDGRCGGDGKLWEPKP